jgi:hypothetical protein
MNKGEYEICQTSAKMKMTNEKWKTEMSHTRFSISICHLSFIIFYANPEQT